MSASIAQAVARYAEHAGPPVARAVRDAAAKVPALAARLADAGLDPRGLTHADLARLPVLAKDEVIALQRQRPPWGGLLAPHACVDRVFQSPGPLYEPQLAGPDPWRWVEALRAAGFSQDDLVLNCFGYHLSPAGAMFDEGCLAVGATVLPGGIGSQDLQAAAIADLGVTAYTGLPSYLRAVIERYDAAGLPPEAWRLSRALVTAEPLPDSLRAELQQRVPTVLMAYGTAEAGLIGYETQPNSGLRPAQDVLVEVCDLDTGMPLTEGEGQVVITLARSDYPLVRFGTGDLSAWTLDAAGQPRLVGVLGRVGAAVKVRGMFLHPRQAAQALADTPGVAAWRLVIDRVAHRDELACEIILSAGHDRAADAERVVAEVTRRLRDRLRFGAAVRIVSQIEDGDQGLIDRRRWD
ncbi:MAG: phenylacetate--CoA ligase family protein [Austwickia sp.]|nr:phenylacetate--CoA ligase family protein [Actinomycetota bacterium]MCB1252056.1 phenylacetate--CoA ligase family protein [Austwickia sp.]